MKYFYYIPVINSGAKATNSDWITILIFAVIAVILLIFLMKD